MGSCHLGGSKPREEAVRWGLALAASQSAFQLYTTTVLCSNEMCGGAEQLRVSHPNLLLDET